LRKSIILIDKKGLKSAKWKTYNKNINTIREAIMYIEEIAKALLPAKKQRSAANRLSNTDYAAYRQVCLS